MCKKVLSDLIHVLEHGVSCQLEWRGCILFPVHMFLCNHFHWWTILEKQVWFMIQKWETQYSVLMEPSSSLNQVCTDVGKASALPYLKKNRAISSFCSMTTLQGKGRWRSVQLCCSSLEGEQVQNSADLGQDIKMPPMLQALYWHDSFGWRWQVRAFGWGERREWKCVSERKR